MDIVFIVTWKDGTIEEFIVPNGYIPNLITTVIDIMRGNRFEKVEIVKKERGLGERTNDKL